MMIQRGLKTHSVSSLVILLANSGTLSHLLNSFTVRLPNFTIKPTSARLRLLQVKRLCSIFVKFKRTDNAYLQVAER